VSDSESNKRLRIETKCPLTSAHTRLRQAHELWHRAAAGYPHPDEFVMNLNQLIVTLRQVTWMLQRQKDKITDFAPWYKKWQDRMKTDPLMNWLNDARTQIEHLGDLDLASTATVSVIASWMDGPYSQFEIPPHVGPERIAADIQTADLPDQVRKEGLLKVERRWVSSDLPEHELTDVCAHGYGVVATIWLRPTSVLGCRCAPLVVRAMLVSSIAYLTSAESYLAC